MAIKKAVSDIRSHKEELISIEKKIKAILEESKKSKNKTEDVDDASGV
jgi:hypothetical protein